MGTILKQLYITSIYSQRSTERFFLTNIAKCFEKPYIAKKSLVPTMFVFYTNISHIVLTNIVARFESYLIKLYICEMTYWLFYF